MANTEEDSELRTLSGFHCLSTGDKGNCLTLIFHTHTPRWGVRHTQVHVPNKLSVKERASVGQLINLFLPLAVNS